MPESEREGYLLHQDLPKESSVYRRKWVILDKIDRKLHIGCEGLLLSLTALWNVGYVPSLKQSGIKFDVDFKDITGVDCINNLTFVVNVSYESKGHIFKAKSISERNAWVKDFKEIVEEIIIQEEDVKRNVSGGPEKTPELWKEETLLLYERNRTQIAGYDQFQGWFISYKQKDGSDAIVERLSHELDGKIWYDNAFVRNRTRSAMIKGIARRDKFVCFVSSNYFCSEWCCMELTIAMKLGKIVVPVFNQDLKTAGEALAVVPECFTSLKRHDFIGLFMDVGVCEIRIRKIIETGASGAIDEFEDSEVD